MIKWLKIILTGILVSMFYFPFEFTFLPGINTKMMIAAVGLAFVFFSFLHQRELIVPKTLLLLLFIASLVSLTALFSITYNRTPDTSYVSYIVSAAVWLSAAFVVCSIIRMVHGRIDVPLIVYYLTGVCTFQCIIALVIEFNVSVQVFVDSWCAGNEFYHEIGRLYGIGAGLDVAGTRFSCVLCAIAFLIGDQNSSTMNLPKTFVLFLAFATITVIGNMIARTTLIGVALGLVYLAYKGAMLLRSPFQEESSRFFGTFMLILIIAVPLVTFFYNYNAQFYELMRFGFEGFFSLIETGKWEVSSNDVLEGMIVWPEELRTWIIGDGYFVSQRYDPNYLGDAPDYAAGYYMGTDIGYLRFIFYFGVIGLCMISAVIIYSAVICCNQYPKYTPLFLLAMIAGFIMWGKSATDIFVFFTLFICATFFMDESDNPTPEAKDPVS